MIYKLHCPSQCVILILPRRLTLFITAFSTPLTSQQRGGRHQIIPAALMKGCRLPSNGRLKQKCFRNVKEKVFLDWILSACSKLLIQNFIPVSASFHMFSIWYPFQIEIQLTLISQYLSINLSPSFIMYW